MTLYQSLHSFLMMMMMMMMTFCVDVDTFSEKNWVIFFFFFFFRGGGWGSVGAPDPEQSALSSFV